MQGHTAEQLHVEMAHLHDPLGAFAHDCKYLDQHVVQRFASRNAVFEHLCLGTQGVVGQTFKLDLLRVDTEYAAAVLLEQTVIATAEYFGQEIGGHECRTAPPTHMGLQSSAIPLFKQEGSGVTGAKHKLRAGAGTDATGGGILPLYGAPLFCPRPQARALGRR